MRLFAHARNHSADEIFRTGGNSLERRINEGLGHLVRDQPERSMDLVLLDGHGFKVWLIGNQSTELAQPFIAELSFQVVAP